MTVLEETARVVSNDQATDGLFFAVLESPQIAGCIEPGQFVHLQVPNMPDRILRRPFSVYQANRSAGTLTVLYQVVGAGTQCMSEMRPGATSSLIGPMGASWSIPEGAMPLLVGGGVGAAPLFMLAQRLSEAEERFHVVLGAQTQAAHVCLDDYAHLPNVILSVSTDDGSLGYAGFCTQPAQEVIDLGECGYVAACGPEPLMRAVSGMAGAAGLPCEVSLERRMACGVGACLSCVVDTKQGKKRCCVDGPIFDAAEVLWS